MVIYLAPKHDEQLAADIERIGGRTDVILRHVYIGGPSIRAIVRSMTSAEVKALVLPDDYHRHSPLMEDVKVCAYHIGMDVMPLTRFLLKHPPAAAPASVHANPEKAAVGSGMHEPGG